MKNPMSKAILWLIFPFVAAFGAYGQQFNGNFGVDFIIIKMHGTSTTHPGGYFDPSSPEYFVMDTSGIVFNYHFGLGYDLPLAKFNSDNVSLGISANLNIGVYLPGRFQGLNNAMTIDLPEYVTLRFGNRCNKDNDEGVGFALGIGYNQALLPFRLGSPSTMMEFSFANQFYIRANMDILTRKLYNYYSSEGLVPSFKLRSIGVVIGRTF